MINTAAIEEYNKVRAYARKKYRPWDDKERKAMEEAAPLLKFALHKQTQTIEQENIQAVIDLARKYDIPNVNICNNVVQFFVHADVPINTHAHLYSNLTNLVSTGSTTRVSPLQHDRLLTLTFGIFYSSRFSSFLMDGSSKSGLYVVGDHDVKFLSTSKEIHQHMWDHGFVAQGTRQPQAVQPSVFSMRDVEEARTLVAFLKEQKFRGAWAARFMNMFYTKNRHMRFEGYAELMKQAREMSKTGN